MWGLNVNVPNTEYLNVDHLFADDSSEYNKIRIMQKI